MRGNSLGESLIVGMSRMNLLGRFLRAVTGALLLLSAMAGLVQANELRSVRIWPSPDSTRVVFDLEAKPDYDHFVLSGPHRLVIDIKGTRNAAELGAVEGKADLVKTLRTSTPPGAGTLRLVLELSGSVKPSLFPLQPTGPYGHRLVVDLFPNASATANVTETTVSGSSGSSTSTMTTTRTMTSGIGRDLVIAVDAGHGGEDPGSIGRSGTKEKKVTLAVARKVAALIEAQPGMRAVMIRNGDYYVNLNRRSELARQSKADLLVSIHADAFTSPVPAGASVWVLSNRRAETEIGRWLEQNEKHSELLGGAGEVLTSAESERYLTRTLLDMSMDHSREMGYSISRSVLAELGKVARLHKSQPESASLAVLKSPDIPSLLIETGFISNLKEEKLLASDAHQQKLARAIARGISGYFEQFPPEGTLLAQRKASGPRTHKVVRGDSLSQLARRYNTSVQALVVANKLPSQNIRIGQVLTIPES